MLSVSCLTAHNTALSGNPSEAAANFKHFPPHFGAQLQPQHVYTPRRSQSAPAMFLPDPCSLQQPLSNILAPKLNDFCSSPKASAFPTVLPLKGKTVPIFDSILSCTASNKQAEKCQANLGGAQSYPLNLYISCFSSSK